MDPFEMYLRFRRAEAIYSTMVLLGLRWLLSFRRRPATDVSPMRDEALKRLDRFAATGSKAIGDTMPPDRLENRKRNEAPATDSPKRPRAKDAPGRDDTNESLIRRLR
jgi:hypothetical protein